MTKGVKLQIGKFIIEQATYVKYLGVFLDQCLNFQQETKNILRKMACGIKTMASINQPLSPKFKRLLLNSG